jgi:hypothetical protein
LTQVKRQSWKSVNIMANMSRSAFDTLTIMSLNGHLSLLTITS